MRLICIFILIFVTACDNTPHPIYSDVKRADIVGLLSHAYRKYTYKQFVSAHKAYLMAFLSFKGANIKPEPELYLGFSALIIHRVQNNTRTYPVSGQLFIIGNEEYLTSRNKIDSLKISLTYLLAARALVGNEDIAKMKVLDEIIACHELYISGKSELCKLVDEKLFAYELN